MQQPALSLVTGRAPRAAAPLSSLLSLKRRASLLHEGGDTLDAMSAAGPEDTSWLLPPLPLAAYGVTDPADVAWVGERRTAHPQPPARTLQRAFGLRRGDRLRFADGEPRPSLTRHPTIPLPCPSRPFGPQPGLGTGLVVHFQPCVGSLTLGQVEHEPAVGIEVRRYDMAAAGEQAGAVGLHRVQTKRTGAATHQQPAAPGVLPEGLHLRCRRKGRPQRRVQRDGRHLPHAQVTQRLAHRLDAAQDAEHRTVDGAQHGRSQGQYQNLEQIARDYESARPEPPRPPTPPTPPAPTSRLRRLWSALKS